MGVETPNTQLLKFERRLKDVGDYVTVGDDLYSFVVDLKFYLRGLLKQSKFKILLLLWRINVTQLGHLSLNLKSFEFEKVILLWVDVEVIE